MEKLEKILIRGIRFYQKYIPYIRPYSPCKFTPSCSEYMIQAIEKYGLKGIAKGLWRIARCNPFTKGGYDPV